MVWAFTLKDLLKIFNGIRQSSRLMWLHIRGLAARDKGSLERRMKIYIHTENLHQKYIYTSLNGDLRRVWSQHCVPRVEKQALHQSIKSNQVHQPTSQLSAPFGSLMVWKIRLFAPSWERLLRRKVSEKEVSDVPRAMLWFGCQKLEAFLISFALGGGAHGTWRSFDSLMIACEWQISDLSQFDGKHARSKFTIPRLICHVFLMLFMG